MHPPTFASAIRQARLPDALVWAVVTVSVLPFFLSLAGVDFSTQVRVFNVESGPTPQGGLKALHQVIQGIFTPTLLEWSAFCTAIFTFFLTCIHFNMTHNRTILVLGTTLFCAGTIDALYTLMMGHLQADMVDSQNFMSFSWTVSRMFYAVMLISSAGLGWVTRRRLWQSKVGLALLVSLALGGMAYGMLRSSSGDIPLPQTLFPEAIVPRPYDAIPLILFLCAGAFVYPHLYQRRPSLFAHALIISTLPNVAAQLHMAFGSRVLFDTHSHMAHCLKIIAYLVPCSGLALDYLRTYREAEYTVQRLTETQASLVERNAQLEQVNADLVRRNAELDEFSYIASHDLQAPVRKLINFCEYLRRDLGSDLPARAAQDIDFIVGAAAHMQQLIQDLLTLSRAGRMTLQRLWISLNTCADRALEALAMRIRETNALITRDPLPMVWGDPTLLTQLYQNLIDNALKFVNNDQPTIRLTAEWHGEQWIFGVQDQGIGLKPEYAEQIFAPFKRLHSQAEYAGTGIGLAICRQAVERHGGRIWVESQPEKGAHFKFILTDSAEAEKRTRHDTQPWQTSDEFAGSSSGANHVTM